MLKKSFSLVVSLCIVLSSLFSCNFTFAEDSKESSLEAIVGNSSENPTSEPLKEGDKGEIKASSADPKTKDTGEWNYLVLGNNKAATKQLRSYNGFGKGYSDDLNFYNFEHKYIDMPNGMTKIGNQMAVSKEIKDNVDSKGNHVLSYLPMCFKFGEKDYTGKTITLSFEFMLKSDDAGSTSETATGTFLTTILGKDDDWIGDAIQTYKKSDVVLEMNKVYTLRFVLKDITKGAAALAHAITFREQSGFSIIYSRFSLTEGEYSLLDVPETKNEQLWQAVNNMNMDINKTDSDSSIGTVDEKSNTDNDVKGDSEIIDDIDLYDNEEIGDIYLSDEETNDAYLLDGNYDPTLENNSSFEPSIGKGVNSGDALNLCVTADALVTFVIAGFMVIFLARKNKMKLSDK